MNEMWINDCIAQYYEWLRQGTSIVQDAQTRWCAITTPFVGLFNDNIVIYAKKDGDRIMLSDDGQTLYNLDLVGVPIVRSGKRKDWLDAILLNYGITLRDCELCAHGSEKDFNQNKFNLLCAISEISDMAMMAKHTAASVFKEDIKSFLDEQKIIYSPQFIIKGNTGLIFTFDYQIAGRQKELVIKSFNAFNTTNVSAFLFSWNDVKEAREKESGKELKGLAIVNDDSRKVKQEYIIALESKGAEIIKWNNRHAPEIIEKLKMAA
jgi:hypothetical protein